MCELEIFVDGACHGNPGPASIGVVILKDGKIIKEIAKTIGEATNNIAEYTALIQALKASKELKASKLKIFTDSELMYYQVTGRYKVNHPKLKLLFHEVKDLSRGFQSVAIQHVPREENKEADRLAGEALKQEKQAKMGASMYIHVGEESPSSKG